MLDKRYNEVIEELNKNMESESDSQYAKMVITELTLMYLDEVNKLEKAYEKKIQLCNLRLAELEQRIEGLENDIFDEEDDDGSICISCPYCNADIILDSSTPENEIECPECKNMIELDWGLLDDDDIM